MISNTLHTQHIYHVSISNDDINANKIIRSKKDGTIKKDNLSKNNNSISIKKKDPLQNLMDQKQKIQDSKQKYLDNALANNESKDSIKDKLKEYEKQLSEIDKQISDFKLEEQKKVMGKDDQEKDKDKKTDKSDDNSKGNKTQASSELDKGSDMMNDLVSLSNNISEAKKLSSEKTMSSDEKSVLENEIKIDEGRGINPIKSKERVAELGDNIENIDKKIGDSLNNINNSDLGDSTSNNENIISNENQKVNSKNNDESDSNKESSSDENLPKSIEDLKLSETIKRYKENKDEKTQINGEKVNAMM